MKKHVVFFEVQGGTDKGENGYRPDTMPMIDSLTEQGWSAEAIFYSHAKRDEIYNYVLEHADAYVPRINPGNLDDETPFFQMLEELSQNGVLGLPTPITMTSYGAKDALVKLRETALVPDDVFAYYKLDTFRANFPKQLASGPRVLKQNRGSTGQGIWRVELVEEIEGIPTADVEIKCTEAVDNHVEYRKLGEFIEFCDQYIQGENGMLIDMPFLPRIKEGEIRVLMLNRKPVFVVHKKPAESADAFSATLFSGAKYQYQQPEDWPALVQLVENSLDSIVAQLGGHALPLIWTADFMLDSDKDGNDIYVLGEINASCVGFSSHLAIAADVAEEIISIVSELGPEYQDR